MTATVSGLCQLLVAKFSNFFMETEENLAKNLAKLEKQAVSKRTGMPVLVIFGGILVLFVLVLNIAC